MMDMKRYLIKEFKINMEEPTMKIIYHTENLLKELDSAHAGNKKISVWKIKPILDWS